MTKLVVVRPETEADLREARAWYESRQTELGKEFLEEIDAVFQRIVERPSLYRKVHRDARRVLMRRFPYSVYFLEEPDRIVILAVLHQKRNPAVWRGRAENVDE